MRQTIARRLTENTSVPTFTVTVAVDMTDLLRLRADLKAIGSGITVTDFIHAATVQALGEFPILNASTDGVTVWKHEHVHLGVAVSVPAGLLVPVVRHAEARDLWSSAAEVARLADAARTGKARRDELSGSTITITSLGPRGGIVTTPIINPPEVAIVGVNRIVERPVIRNGAVVPRLLMNLSSSFDHRVVDGQHAADFVQALRGYLECPALLFVDP